MQTNAIPVIEASDLKAAREFLTESRGDQTPTRAARVPRDAHAVVTVHNGIARARTRSAANRPA